MHSLDTRSLGFGLRRLAALAPSFSAEAKPYPGAPQWIPLHCSCHLFPLKPETKGTISRMLLSISALQSDSSLSLMTPSARLIAHWPWLVSKPFSRTCVHPCRQKLREQMEELATRNMLITTEKVPPLSNLVPYAWGWVEPSRRFPSESWASREEIHIWQPPRSCFPPVAWASHSWDTVLLSTRQGMGCKFLGSVWHIPTWHQAGTQSSVVMWQMVRRGMRDGSVFLPLCKLPTSPWAGNRWNGTSYY